jgi:hypothetical protein
MYSHSHAIPHTRYVHAHVSLVKRWYCLEDLKAGLAA